MQDSPHKGHKSGIKKSQIQVAKGLFSAFFLFTICWYVFNKIKYNIFISNFLRLPYGKKKWNI
jgi:hypothetical protein